MRFSDLKAPVLAGTVASITGTAASIALVVSAFQGLGATRAQSSSAVFAMLMLYGLLSIVLSWRYRMPISIVWSTPGAALLVASSTLGFGFSSVVAAFLVCGLLLALTGLWPALGHLVSAIPKPIASAMLAGVIFTFCISPFTAGVMWPGIVLPGIAVWLLLYRFATIWAAPAAMATIFALAAFQLGANYSSISAAPVLELVSPSFDLAAVVSIAIPLYLVTMASQNVPGIAIMKSFGYEVPFRPVMLATGLSTTLGSFFGGFALNLAAITAALNANEHAHKDPSRRWLASVFGGVLYIALAFATSTLVSFVAQTPREVILAVAGLALVPTIANALVATVEAPAIRVPAVLTFLVGASGIAILGVGSAFWALTAGLLAWLVLGLRTETKAS